MLIGQCRGKVVDIADFALNAELHGVDEPAADDDARRLSAVEGIGVVAAVGDHGIRRLPQGDEDVMIRRLAVDGHHEVVALPELTDGAAGVGIAHLAEGVVIGGDVLPVIDEHRTPVEREADLVFVNEALGGFLVGEGILIGKEHVAAAVKQAALPAVQTAAHELPVIHEKADIPAAVVVIVPAAGDDGVCLRGHLGGIVELIAAEFVVGELAPELACVGNKDLAEGADGAVLILLPDERQDRLVEIVVMRRYAP